MEIPNFSNDLLAAVLRGKINFDFDFLALKILLLRLRLRVSQDPSPSVLQASIAELKALFIKFARIPALQRDLAKMQQMGGYHE
jgi:hypothetical protein